MMSWVFQGYTIWSGLSDHADEGIFVNENVPSMQLEKGNMSLNWKKGEPNGGIRENCALMEKNHGLVDVPCDRKVCGICDLPSPLFHMKGLCQKSTFDIEYSWTGEYTNKKTKKYTFVGVGNGGFLFWDDSQKHWKLENIEDKKIFAILNETESSYPFGTHFWYIFNDNCKNLGVAVAPNTYRTELSFNVCKEDMFNCHDGTWYVNLPYFCQYKPHFFCPTF